MKCLRQLLILFGVLVGAMGTGAAGPIALATRLKVVSNKSVQKDFAWCGKKVPVATWTKALDEQLRTCLAATKQFAVPVGGGASVTNLLLACDVRLKDVPPQEIDPATKQVRPRTSAPFAEISYRVVAPSVDRIKWTDRVELDAACFAAAGVDDFVRHTAEAAASSIVDGLLANVIPYEIAGRTEKGLLLVGEGGTPLRAGEFLTVFALGDAVKDPHTGQVADRFEDAVGTVQIVRADAKRGEAQIVEGDSAKMVKGARLRRVSPIAR